MSDDNPHRAETRKILLGSPSHYANALRDMEAGRAVEECARDRHVEPKRIELLRASISMTLDGEVTSGLTRVRNQADVYQDLLNYSMSPELRQHFDLRFAQFQTVDPSLKKEPLRYTKLRANDRRKQPDSRTACSECNT